MRAHCRSLSLMLAALAVAGCDGPAADPNACNPPCGAGARCVAAACAPDAPADLAVEVLDALPADLDLSSMGKDLALGCAPACSGASPFCNDHQRCVPCLADEHCPAGTVCRPIGMVSSCVPGCSGDARCALDGGAPSLCCGGACTDTTKDVLNCGACGKACSVPHAASTCAAGQCAAGACDPGWGDCNVDPADGCESNLHVSVENCVKCGTKCAFRNGVVGCADGCYLAACVFGSDDCNGDPTDGCEASVLSDVANCGGCGQACGAVAHARTTCVSAACQLLACDAGFSDCDGNWKTGCEVSTSTDKANCGKCGAVCAQGLVCKNAACTCPQCNIPNAKTACVNNQCVLDACLPNYADCNKNLVDGCEVNTFNSPSNCGGCGVVCPKNTPACLKGQCAKGCLYQASVLASNPIGYWPLDDMGGPALDLSATPHNGTIFGAPQMGVAGVSGTAMLFHGNTDHIRVGPVTSQTMSEVSYEFWMYLAALPGGSITAVWDDDSKGGGDSWVQVKSTGNIESMRANDGFGDFTSTNAVGAGVWNHFVMVGDVNGKRFYLNGVLDSSTNVQMSTRTNRSYVTIGASFDGNSYPGGAQYFDGTLDEVAIYDHALTANEVADHYANACGL